MLQVRYRVSGRSGGIDFVEPEIKNVTPNEGETWWLDRMVGRAALPASIYLRPRR